MFQFSGGQGWVLTLIGTLVHVICAVGAGDQTAQFFSSFAFPSQPWLLVSWDFIVELPHSQGCTIILVAVNLFTKIRHFISNHFHPTIQETACLFLDHVFQLQELNSLSLRFTINFFFSFLGKLCRLLGMELLIFLSYYPADQWADRIGEPGLQPIATLLSRLSSKWLGHSPNICRVCVPQLHPCNYPS